MKVEQVDGPAGARHQDRQGGDRAATASASRRAGRDRRGDRRARGRASCSRATGAFQIVVRLPDSCARRRRGAGESAGAAAAGGADAPAPTIPLKQVATFSIRRGAEPDQPRERQAPHRRDAPMCAAATSARSSTEAQAKIAATGRTCRRATGSPGAASSRTSPPRAQRLDDRRAGLLRPDLPAALFARSAPRATRCWCSPPCRWR